MVHSRATRHAQHHPVLRICGTLSFALLALLLASGSTLSAQTTIASYTAGVQANSFVPGETFTTPAGGPWTNITFNFYSDVHAAIPAAVGTAYLLTQPYTGTPAALSSSTPGFVAASTGVSGGRYVFASSVTLQPNTQYYVYSDSAFTLSGSSAAGSASASLYAAASTTSNFTALPTQRANFLVASLTPTPTSVPALGIPGLVGLGILLSAAGVFLARWRNRATI